MQRLDQLVALREPLKKPPNRRRSRHRKIINPVDAKIKLTRRERGPDQLLLVLLGTAGHAVGGRRHYW